VKKVLQTLHIGVGNRGAWPLKLGTPDNGFRPVALCDVSQAAMEEARARVGLSREACFADAESALARAGDLGIDCVIICTPTRFHVSLAKLAISKRLPVLVEKGMATDFASASELVRAAEESGVPVCIAQNYRYRSLERTVWTCLHQRENAYRLGRVLVMDYVHHRVRPEPRTLTYPFACVWDMSCHHFDNLLAWLGPAEWMQAASYAAPWSAYPHDGNTSAIIRMANGTTVNYVHTHDASRGHEVLWLQGERGALWLEQGQLMFSERPTEQFGRRAAQQVPRVEGPAEAGVLADFYRYVAEGLEPGISARNNLEVMAMCQMMVESISADGRRVGRTEISANVAR
jgi:predicted dehydrogenase